MNSVFQAILVGTLIVFAVPTSGLAYESDSEIELEMLDELCLREQSLTRQRTYACAGFQSLSGSNWSITG